MAKKHQKELGGRNMSTGTRIVVGIFAVVMALSMMLPSLAPIFASETASQQAEQEDENANEAKTPTEEEAVSEDEEAAPDGTLDEAIVNVPDNESLKSLAEQYEDSNAKFLKRLEEDPNDLAALLNLGQNYMNWGYSATHSSSTDEETAYSKALVNKAIEYYDRYLKLHDSDAAKVQRALCQYYAGDTDEAIAALTAMTEQNPDYALAWANLGMLYEQQSDYDKALEAYGKASKADPDDEYGVKSYADQRIAAINSSRTSFSDLTNEQLLGTDSKPQEGFAGVVANESGI